jgi:hypothetical protein
LGCFEFSALFCGALGKFETRRNPVDRHTLWGLQYRHLISQLNHGEQCLQLLAHCRRIISHDPFQRFAV